MSNYQRNNTMVACIIGVIVVGAIAVGAIAWFGTTSWNWPGRNWQATTEYSFTQEPSSLPEFTTVNLSIQAGAVRVVFVDDVNLLYRVDMIVPNQTITEFGAPEVSYESEVMTLDYQAAMVNVTLGTGTNYSLVIDVAAGQCTVVMNEYSHIGDVDITATAGGIDLTFSDDVTLYDADVDFTLEATTGGIEIAIDLPTGTGGRLTTSTGLGSVDVTNNGWNQITADHYETSDYSTAERSLTISATTSAGSIDAILS